MTCMIFPQPNHCSRIILQIFRQNIDGVPFSSTGKGLLPVVSTPIPIIFSGENPGSSFPAFFIASFIVTSIPSR